MDKNFIIILIECYQTYLSPFFGQRCRFLPSCSEYAKTAILQFGVGRGIFLAIMRLLRCHPFCQGGYDPVQKRFTQT